MPTHYSTRFKEKMLRNMTGPGARSANALAVDAGVSQNTLSRWLREAKLGPVSNEKRSGPASKRKRWTPEERIRVVREAAAAGDGGLGALLRREGLHQADMDRFREEILEAAAKGFQSEKKQRGATPEQKRIQKLERELRRKEKALAEAAALLVLGKKLEALFPSEEEGGDTDGSSE